MVPQDAFDPHTFLAKVGAGRTLVTCPPQHPIFTQGEAANAVFYRDSENDSCFITLPSLQAIRSSAS
jgi:hypothetical protein